jgi:hypothetical protein
MEQTVPLQNGGMGKKEGGVPGLMSVWNPTKQQG